MNDTPYQPHEINWTPDKANRLWSYYSKSSSHQNKYFGRVAGRQVSKLIRKKGLLRSANNILDFSCGKGDLIAHLSSHLNKNQSISGVDVSSESIEETISRNQQNSNFTGAIVSTVWPGSLPSHTQDLLIATEVIEHLHDDEINQALSECRRILKPGAHLFVTTPNQEDLNVDKTLCPECGCIFHRWQHMQSWTAERLSNCLESNGFVVKECNTILWGPLAARLYFKLARLKVNGLFAIATAK